jgi:hypothetical protein
MHEDRRQYSTAQPIFEWHAANEDILFNREPVADVGVIWSQENHDFAGQDQFTQRTLAPYLGTTAALDRAGLTWMPVHADHIARDGHRFGVLVLPNVAAMSDSQLKAIQAYSAAGGSVIATSNTSSLDAFGGERARLGLGDLFGITVTGDAFGGQGPIDSNVEVSDRHSYLRLSPELRGSVDGPRDATAPVGADSPRHPIFDGLEQTDIIPFSGYLPVVNTAPDVRVLATLVPNFPIFPPETAWMREPRTDLPAITVRESKNGSKLIWLVADVDRCFARDQNAEHGLLIANAARWAIGKPLHVSLEGGLGQISATMYSQGDRDIIHFNNRTTTTPVAGRQHELIPIRSTRVIVRSRSDCKAPLRVHLRVKGTWCAAESVAGGVAFEVGDIFDHEVAVLDWTR